MKLLAPRHPASSAGCTSVRKPCCTFGRCPRAIRVVPLGLQVHPRQRPKPHIVAQAFSLLLAGLTFLCKRTCVRSDLKERKQKGKSQGREHMGWPPGSLSTLPALSLTQRPSCRQPVCAKSVLFSHLSLEIRGHARESHNRVAK